MKETADASSVATGTEVDYDAIGHTLIGRRAVHIAHGEGIIKQYAFDKRAERNLLSVSLLDHESRDMHQRTWREWLSKGSHPDRHHARRHGAVTFKVPVPLLLNGNDRYGWCLIPEQVEGVDVEIAQERILDSIVNMPLTLDPETLISTEPRLALTTGPQPGYYLGYLDLDSEIDMIDHLVHGIDYAASAAISYLNRGSRRANNRWTEQHLTATPGDLWEGILHLGLRDDIKESFARICVMLTKSGVEDRDNVDETTSFARRIIEATEQRILGYLEDEFNQLRAKSAA